MCHLVHLRNIREELYLLCGLPVDDLQPTCVFSPHPVYNQKHNLWTNTKVLLLHLGV